MRLRVVVVLAAASCFLVPATPVLASEWEPEREYFTFAIDPSDEVRYGGYTDLPNSFGAKSFIDVVDRFGTVLRTIQLPRLEGRSTILWDVATFGSLLIASYSVGGTEEGSFDDRQALSLFQNGKEIARGSWVENPYVRTFNVALNDEWVILDYADSGFPYGSWVFAVDDIPPLGTDAADLIGPHFIPRAGVIEPVRVAPQTGPSDISVSGESVFIYWYDFDDEGAPRQLVDVYSLGPEPELSKTIIFSGLDASVSMWNADHGVNGSFVVAGRSAPAVEWCSVWTHGPDGSLEDCFLARPGGAAISRTHFGSIDPFDVDACGGIVVADVEAENGVLTGHKLIPSDRDPGCFVDSLDSTFASHIEAIGRSGMTKGCNPPDKDRFCPDDFVTRGQMAAFVVRAMGYTDNGGGDLFVDDDENTFENDIDVLATAGVTKGCNPPDNDRFCPDDRVTRGQMAAFVVRAMGYTDNGEGDLFVDDDGNTFENDIDRLATAGVTKGCNPPNNDRFCPDNFVTRGQMAAFIDRALRLGAQP